MSSDTGHAVHRISGSPEIGKSKMRKSGKPDLHRTSGSPGVGQSKMRKSGKPDLHPTSGSPGVGQSKMCKSGKPDLRCERVAKVIARAGLASRREAEAWIAAGRVAVNGKPISSPACKVTALDRIVVDGKALPARERTRLFLYHKPRGLVTSHGD